MITSTRSRTIAAGFAATVAVLFALAGCSGAPSENSAPTSSSGAAASGGEAEFQAARDAYDLKLAQCLRDAGFDVKDPVPGQGITEMSPDLNAAASVCMGELGDPPQSNAVVNKTDMLNDMLKLAECFRDRGLQVEEPRLGEAFLMPVDATEEDVAACVDPV